MLKDIRKDASIWSFVVFTRQIRGIVEGAAGVMFTRILSRTRIRVNDMVTIHGYMNGNRTIVVDLITQMHIARILHANVTEIRRIGIRKGDVTIRGIERLMLLNDGRYGRIHDPASGSAFLDIRLLFFIVVVYNVTALRRGISNAIIVRSYNRDFLRRTSSLAAKPVDRMTLGRHNSTIHFVLLLLTLMVITVERLMLLLHQCRCCTNIAIHALR
ncbi:hypothetical protein DBV15_07227 [Temnothorax longispinosus]|uniref:Uncharacterized protein n=1 Tax=Temnothorax longispinosus TaxID=300112 RepID=A0A4S2JBJ9_9HYME|nr:hypothetical protein DBV15_07227 [Temnothorax longispinosus]